MRRWNLLLTKEIKDLILSRAALVLMLILSVVIGYSFYSAVVLYGNASGAAIDNPLYATGFEPVPGVFTPTFGGLFIVFSLFLPFLLIPQITQERRNNTLTVLLQVPFSWLEILTAKCCAAVLFVLFALALTLPAVVLWSVWGGHVPYGELALLATGYLLYGIFIASVSLFAAALFDDTARAAIVTVIVIIASWLIDFGRDMNISPLVTAVSDWTVTRMVKLFENGILSAQANAYFLLLSLGFAACGYWLLRFDVRQKWRHLTATAFIIITALYFSAHLHLNADLSESKRNSFPPHIAEALKKVPTLTIEVYLEKTDSRFRDYQKSFLEKLYLVKPNAKVAMNSGAALKENYGRFVYHINDREDATFSTGDEEIFPIIFGLAGIEPTREGELSIYPGYPLVTSPRSQGAILWVYLAVIPALMILMFTTVHFRPRKRSEAHE